MTSLDQLKLTFFDECGEAMQDIETGLTEMREGGASDDTVNAVFRAVHSVKGGAGIFGFEALVRFAHVFETVLDSVRHGTLSAGPETVDVLLTASDVLTDLVTMSRAGEAIAEDFGGDCRAALERLIGADEEGAAGDGGAAPDFDIDFVPLRADGFDAPEEGARTYAITFRPRPELLRHANEPLYLIRELRKLGDLDL
ncbi:MAG: chemotaxis protein CheA, partial [Proteobacteria bacterium]